MEKREKEILKLKTGLSLIKVINDNRKKAIANKENNLKDHMLISSLRKLAAASGIDFGSVQKISVGQIGPEFITLLTLTDALNINLTYFAAIFDSITDDNALEYQRDITKSKKERAKKKRKK